MAATCGVLLNVVLPVAFGYWLATRENRRREQRLEQRLDEIRSRGQARS